MNLINASAGAINHTKARIEAADVILFAQLNQKIHYDRLHQSMYLKVEEWALLRLHKSYSIPSTIEVIKKLFQQYVGPFRVIQKIGKLAYKLNVPSHWRIHSVFTIAQLEPAPDPNSDSYKRSRPNHPDTIYVDGDTEAYKSYEIDRLLNRKVIRKGRNSITQYLVRWKGYEPEYDQWYFAKKLDNAQKLIAEYEEAHQAILS